MSAAAIIMILFFLVSSALSFMAGMQIGSLRQLRGEHERLLSFIDRWVERLPQEMPAESLQDLHKAIRAVGRQDAEWIREYFRKRGLDVPL